MAHSMLMRWGRGLAAALLIAAGAAAQAQDKVSVTTTWFAQAEHGGLYQALATGIYKKHGLDVTIRMGGPQVNGIQLLLAGQSDFVMNYDFAVLSGVERGFPLVTVAAPFQFDIQGLLAHEDVTDLSQLKDRTVLVAGTFRTAVSAASAFPPRFTSALTQSCSSPERARAAGWADDAAGAAPKSILSRNSSTDRKSVV